MLNNLKHPMFQYDHYHYQSFTYANLSIITTKTNIYMHLKYCITVHYYKEVKKNGIYRLNELILGEIKMGLFKRFINIEVL